MWNTHTEGRRAPCDRAGWLLVALFALTLAGCGGGGETVAVAQPHVSAASAVSPLDRPPVDHPAVKALFANARVASIAPSISLSTLTAIETLFDSVAEGRFPQFFPPHQATLVHPSFRFRYYSATGTYVGVATVDVNGLVPNGVYVMGGVFGGAPVYIAMMYDFVAAPPVEKVYAMRGAFGFPKLVDVENGRLVPPDNQTGVLSVYGCKWGPLTSAGRQPYRCVDGDQSLVIGKVAYFQAFIDARTNTAKLVPVNDQIQGDEALWKATVADNPHHDKWAAAVDVVGGIYYAYVVNSFDVSNVWFVGADGNARIVVPGDFATDGSVVYLLKILVSSDNT